MFSLLSYRWFKTKRKTGKPWGAARLNSYLDEVGDGGGGRGGQAQDEQRAEVRAHGAARRRRAREQRARRLVVRAAAATDRHADAVLATFSSFNTLRITFKF